METGSCFCKGAVMRSLVRNKQKMFYALQTDEEVPVYERDSEGNVVYRTIGGKRVPVETGTYELGYSDAVEFYNGISGELTAYELQAFGVDNSDGYAKMTYPRDKFPFQLGTLIWKKSEVKYVAFRVDPKSADYQVVAIRDEDLDEWSVLLKRILK